MTPPRLDEGSEREAFEAAYMDRLGLRAEDYGLEYDSASNRYADDEEQGAWWAWQARAALSTGRLGGEVPEGWKLVPAAPTKEMIEAAMHVKRIRLLDVVAQFRAGMDETEARTPAIVGEWEAMLAVAPPAPAAQPQGDKSHE